jgi:hypothetical protein
MTAVTILTKTQFIVLKERALKIPSDVQITDAFRQLGIAMEMTIVEMAPMNRQNIANRKAELALEIFSLAITAIVCQEFIFAMVRAKIGEIYVKLKLIYF